MIAETGLYALILALLVAAVQSVLPLTGTARNEYSWMALAPAAALAQLVAVAAAFGALIFVHVTSDFSVLTVAMHSHTAKPLLYKIAGVWANHEGSMLLWALILSACGGAVAVSGRSRPPDRQARILSVQGMVSFAFLAFILFTSDPFSRLDPAPANGAGLNPLLQDVSLALHPPFLYLGYGGFAVVFAFAVAALIEGNVDGNWARQVRPWVLTGWCALTLGIGLGSWWSYYTLGWGGWWAWDPVENAALMPWLTGTALLHSVAVVEKRGTLKGWTVLLAILTFTLSLTGTFLVRSGVLTSVHAFADDPERGRFILGLIVLLGGGALAVFAVRAGRFKPGSLFAPVSRESTLLFNNLFLAAAAGTVMTGTLAPLFADVMHLPKLSVGAPYFDTVIPLLLTPMLILMPAGPFLAWRRGNAKDALKQLRFAALIAAAAIIITLLVTGTAKADAIAALGLGLGVWVIAASLTAWKKHAPRGMVLAHLGTGIVVIGIAASAWQSEHLLVMRPGQSVEIAGYSVRFSGLETGVRGPNYTAERGLFTVIKDANTLAVLHPERRLYDHPPAAKTEVAISTDLISDLYLVLGDATEGGRAVHLFHKPLVPWIFLGALVMVLGGIVALTGPRTHDETQRPPVPAATAFRSTLPYALPALVFLALAAVFFWRLNQTERGDPADRIPSVLIGKPAPAFDLAPLYLGQPRLTGADLKGRITLVHFFASWCGPCRGELSVLKRATGRGLTVMGIAYKDKPEAAQRFLDEYGNPFARIAIDPGGRAAIDFGVYGVPETFLVDSNGIIRFKQTGPLTKRVLEQEILPLAESLK